MRNPSNYDPYQSSVDEESSQNALLNEVSDTFSINSDLSYIEGKRRSMLCGCLFPMNNGANVPYTAKKKHLQEMALSEEKLLQMELELDAERRKGRSLCVALFMMTFFCAALFLDRLQGDWRAYLIEILEKENMHDSTQNAGKITRPDGVYSGNDNVATYGTLENSTHPGLSSMEQNYTELSSPPGEEDDKVTVESEEIEDDWKGNNNGIEQLTRLVKWNLPFKKDRDVPIYWHVPLCGALVMNELLSNCYGLIQATDDVGLLDGHQYDSELAIITNDGGKYINVDMGTIEGIERAKLLNLASAGVTDVIRTSYLYETASIFNGTPKYGKCFTMLRHPIERAVAVFEKLKTSSNPVFQSMNLEEYVKSNFCEENWMTRFLSNEMNSPLERKHLELAQSILGRKCIIGFTDNFDESVLRFSKYFYWDQNVPKSNLDECQNELNIDNHTIHSPVDDNQNVLYAEGTEVWNILKEKNSYDLELFEYAKVLYRQQSLYG